MSPPRSLPPRLPGLGPPPSATGEKLPPAGPLAAGDAPPAPDAGFTLIELMIVTVILGILAMLAFPFYRDVRADAARRALQQQVRSLAQAQRIHFLERDAYAVDAGDLDYRPAERLELELRVGPEGAGPGDAGAPGQAKKGWTGRLTDPAYGVRCAVFHGSADPLAPAVAEGVIACDDGG